MLQPPHSRGCTRCPSCRPATACALWSQLPRPLLLHLRHPRRWRPPRPHRWRPLPRAPPLRPSRPLPPPRARSTRAPPSAQPLLRARAAPASRACGPTRPPSRRSSRRAAPSRPARTPTASARPTARRTPLCLSRQARRASAASVSGGGAVGAARRVTRTSAPSPLPPRSRGRVLPGLHALRRRPARVLHWLRCWCRGYHDGAAGRAGICGVRVVCCGRRAVRCRDWRSGRRRRLRRCCSRCRCSRLDARACAQAQRRTHHAPGAPSRRRRRGGIACGHGASGRPRQRVARPHLWLAAPVRLGTL